MKKEQVTIFNLEDAFKALDELEIPKAERGIKANKTDLVESFKDFNRSRTDLLMEDYYDIADSADLEEAKAEREAEVAKAKLARIEKIVDLEAESEEDLLPSYVGKMIIQCPQCMTLFYKDEADIVKSETDEETVNVAEACQHCGNDAGYTLIGKVEGVKEEEFTQEDEVVEDESVEEAPIEETSVEDEENTEIEAEPEVENGEEDLELSEIPEEDEVVVEESLNQNKSLVESSISSISDFIIYGLDKENVEIVKNKVTGSESIVKRCANKILKENPEIYYIYVSELVDGNEVPRDDLELVRSELAVDEKDYFNNEAETDGYIVYGCDENFNVIEQKQVKIREAVHKTGKEMLDANKNIIYIYVSQLIAGKEIVRDDLEMVRYGYDEEELADDELLMAESLTEDIDKDLQDKLDAHNDYIKYLQEEISKEEKALEEAKNDFIKEAIQRRIDALKEDLEKALPEEVKEIKEVVTEEDAEKPLEIEDEEIVSNIEDEIQDENKEEVEVETVAEVEEEKAEEVEAEEEVKESLTEAKESKMKKLSGAEFDDLMDFLADQKNESFEDLDHVDEKRFAKCLGEALNRKEKTVKAVKVESCSLAPDNRLIIECKVKLLDNTTANINYICKGFINKENQKLIEGITEGYINKEFICNYTFENRTLITESIRHSK